MLTPYPQIVEYNEAVQHPATAFRDPELRQGRITTNALGLPVVLSGGFALTYMMAAPQRRLALRCFHREIPAAEQKYAAITKTLKVLRSPYFVGFDFVPDGVRIRGGFYPVLKMDWAEGAPLGIWLDRYSTDRGALEKLRHAFAGLAGFLDEAGVAHGDIQNGNVIVSRAGLKLVDYDGMYVPGMPVEFGCESGHKHFQHPRRTTADFGPTLDRFSFIAVDLSLAALAEDPSLYRRFRQGGETILFRANDFADPEHSEAFRWLDRHPGLRSAAANFAAVCRADIGSVPSLADFQAGRNIPAATAVSVPTPAAQTTANRPQASADRYIAPYPVLRGEDFAAVGRCVGQRVELVGRVSGVRAGSGEHGRRRGQPCIFVDFAPSRQDGVTITLWTDEAASSSDLPTDRWVGRWVSIVGLIDPPRIERHFWRGSTHVGISTPNAGEIDLISPVEAEFRLHRGERGAAVPPSPVSRRGLQAAAGDNRGIVGRLQRSDHANSRPGSAAPSRPAVVRRPGPSNQAIVRALRTADAKPAQPQARSAAPSPAMGVAAGTIAVTSAPQTRTPRLASGAAIPQSGSFVIHPRNRSPRAPAQPAGASAPTAWQRILGFFGVEA